MDWMLGSASDVEVARRLGLPKHIVFARRRKLGIAPAQVRSRPFTSEEDALLGTDHDRVIAKQLGCKALAVSHRRKVLGIPAFESRRKWTRWEDELLGTVSDEAVAERLGCSPGAVKARRNMLRIKLPSKPRGTRLSADEIALLGTESDEKIARRLG
ncbi:MAG: hypothetical protein ACPGVU_25995, partial [Limisphaerales bacterium]